MATLKDFLPVRKANVFRESTKDGANTPATLVGKKRKLEAAVDTIIETPTKLPVLNKPLAAVVAIESTTEPRRSPRLRNRQINTTANSTLSTRPSHIPRPTTGKKNVSRRQTKPSTKAQSGAGNCGRVTKRARSTSEDSGKKGTSTAAEDGQQVLCFDRPVDSTSVTKSKSPVKSVSQVVVTESNFLDFGTPNTGFMAACATPQTRNVDANTMSTPLDPPMSACKVNPFLVSSQETKPASPTCTSSTLPLITGKQEKSPGTTSPIDHLSTLAQRQKENASMREARINHRYGIDKLLKDDSVPTSTLPTPTPSENGSGVSAQESTQEIGSTSQTRGSEMSTTCNQTHPAVQLATSTMSLPGLPAFQKFHHIRTPHSAWDRLALPTHLQRLDVIFQAIEHTLLFLQGQSQPCVYHRIKKPVENMCRRTFELSHLGQIKTLYPEAYQLTAVRYQHLGERIPSVEIQWPTESPTTSLSPGSTPDTVNKGKDSPLPDPFGGTPTKLPNWTRPPRTDSTTDTKFVGQGVRSVMSTENRRQEFRKRLLRYTHKHHSNFLRQLQYDTLPELEQLSQWHPDFQVENAVPEVPCAEIPRLELHTMSHQRVQDLLSRLKRRVPPLPANTDKEKPEVSNADNIVGPANVTSDVSSSVTLTKDADDSKNSLDVQSGSHPGLQTPPNQRTKTVSLLDRIRRKEKQRKQAIMLGEISSSETITRRAMLSRLPDMTDTLSFLFYSSKRNVMRLNELAPRLSDSYKTPLSESEAVQHIHLLSTVAPEWCKLVTVGSDTMVRLDRLVAVKKVKELIHAKLKAP
ncbi:hypothetical protein IWQ62_003102 [Dispira parvispora]|uniref:CDT1 Geminin-binding domain-containing protein n=1 Tax=Dispira parvispora TaxID=1520584 RepID=A0A9W8AQ06_9FUNG|nr:hypothetical protein IWQ62_003102 [Dispira parvispora]